MNDPQRLTYMLGTLAEDRWMVRRNWQRRQRVESKPVYRPRLAAMVIVLLPWIAIYIVWKLA